MKGRNEVEKVLVFPLFYAMEIKKMLLNKTYNPMKSIEFKIIDGVSRKTRIIHKPKFYPDQGV